MNFTQDGGTPPRNYVGIGIVILLHIILIYALINGLARKVVDIVQQPVETKIIKQYIPPPPPPPPKKIEPPKMVEKPVTPPPPVVPPPFVPKTEVKVATPPPPMQTQATPPPPAPPAPVQEPAPSVHKGVSTSSMTGCSKPEYPAQALQEEEQGVTRLKLLIAPDGSVKEATVAKSSGFRDLDRAAVVALKLCTFKPATLDGKPIEEAGYLEYAWTLPE